MKKNYSVKQTLVFSILILTLMLSEIDIAYQIFTRGGGDKIKQNLLNHRLHIL